MQVATRSLVQSIDLYLPDEGGERLYWQCGADNRWPDGRGWGEGAIGRSWAERSPAIDVDPNNPNVATIALPCLRGEECRGVVVFECFASDGLRGAFEVWRRDERGELGLTESWYANLERLELISRYVRFPRRAGLPGRIWDDRFPRVLGALTESKSFLRVAMARTEQLSSALGIPYMHKPPELDAALLILNAEASPIAKAVEVWARDLATGQLRIVSAEYGPYTALAAASRKVTLRHGEGIAGRVFDEGAPWLTNDLLGREFPRGDRFVEHGFEMGVGLPVFVGTDLVASVNLYL